MTERRPSPRPSSRRRRGGGAQAAAWTPWRSRPGPHDALGRRGGGGRGGGRRGRARQGRRGRRRAARQRLRLHPPVAARADRRRRLHLGGAGQALRARLRRPHRRPAAPAAPLRALPVAGAHRHDQRPPGRRGRRGHPLRGPADRVPGRPLRARLRGSDAQGDRVADAVRQGLARRARRTGAGRQERGAAAPARGARRDRGCRGVAGARGRAPGGARRGRRRELRRLVRRAGAGRRVGGRAGAPCRRPRRRRRRARRHARVPAAGRGAPRTGGRPQHRRAAAR